MPDTELHDDDADSQDAKGLAIVKSLAVQMAEHFESVQIIAVRNNAETSVPFHYGEGSWYSRYGATKEWVKRQEKHMLRGME